MSIFVPERFVFENVLILIYVAVSTVLTDFLFIAARIFSLHTKKTYKRNKCLCLVVLFTVGVYISIQFILHVHICRCITGWTCCSVPWCVMWLQELPWRFHSPVIPSFCQISSKCSGAQGFPAAALSAWPALKSHHHQRKRALKCLELLSSGVPFTTLWKPQSPQPDNCSRCLDGIQIAAYSLHTVRMAQSPVFLLYSPPSPLSFALLLPLSHIYSFSLRMFPKCFC